MGSFNDDMNSFLASADEKVAADKEVFTSVKDQGAVEGMFNSFTSSFAEGFGADPTEASIQAQKDNPLSSFVGDVAGIVAPFGAVAKLGQVGKFAKTLDKVEDFFDKDKRPILAGAARNTALFAPLEVGRAAAAQVVEGGKNAEDITADAIFNLALEASFGGLGGFIKAAGKKKLKEGRSIKQKFKDTDQAKARDISKGLETKTIPDENIPLAKNQLTKLREQIRVAEPAKKKITGKKGDPENYVAPLKVGKAQSLNRLFKPNEGKKSGIKVRRFIQGAENAFPTKIARDDALLKAGIKDLEEFTLYPRLITASTKKASATVHDTLVKQAGLSAIDDGVLVGKEVDGLFVVAKKVTGDTGKRGAGDEYTLFKTDQPQLFAPKAKQFADIQENSALFNAEKPRVRDPNNPTELLDYAEDLEEQFPLELMVEATEKAGDSIGGTGKKGEGITNQVLSLIGLEVKEGGGQFTDSVKHFVNSFLTPAMHQFKGNKIAGHVHGVTRAIHARADNLVNEIMFGKTKTSTGNLFEEIRTGAVRDSRFRGGKSVDLAIGQLDAKAGEVAEFTKLWAKSTNFKDIQKAFEDGEISRKVYNSFKELEKIDDFVFGEVVTTQKATGEKVAQRLEGHYGLSRKWEGSIRVFMKNEAGELVHVVGARNKATAEARAAAIKAELEAEGIVLKQSDAIVQNTHDDIATESHIKVNSQESSSIEDAIDRLNEGTAQPTAFKERKGVGGFQTTFTKEELIKRYQADVQQRLTYTAEITSDRTSTKELLALADEDMTLFNDVTKRMDQLAGKTGGLNEGVNKVFDKILGNSLGKNSADQITRATNEFMHHWQLGSFNMSFPVLNALTFIQTVFPEAAYVTKAPKGRVAAHYGYDMMEGGAGTPVGSLGFVDMARLMKNSMKELGNPDPAFRKTFDRAMNDGVVDARFVEAINSEAGGFKGRLKDSLQSDKPFLNFGRELSNALPGGSERFARGQSFTLGHILGRDFLNFPEGSEELYRFAKTFTERTMFNYGTADRAQVMTGALGSAFGLFKNWQTHYIYNMLEYAGEATRGNFSPLMWQMGGTMAMGGVRALPVFGMVEGASRVLTDKSSMENLYNGFGGVDANNTTGSLVDALYFGAPSFAGISMSGQASAPGSDPSRDMAMLFSFAQANRAANMGKAVNEAFTTWQTTGQHPASSQAVRDKMTLAFLPKSVARYSSIVENDALKSLNTGNITIEGLNTAEKMMVMSGFMPLKQARQLEANQEAWRTRDVMNKKVQNFGKAWAEAQIAKDSGELNQLRRQIIVEGVPLDRVMQSSMNRIANKTEDRSTQRLDPDKVFELQRLGLIQR